MKKTAKTSAARRMAPLDSILKKTRKAGFVVTKKMLKEEFARERAELLAAVVAFNNADPYTWMGYDWSDLDVNGNPDANLRSAIKMYAHAQQTLGQELVDYASRGVLSPDLRKIVERATRDVEKEPNYWERFWQRAN